MRISIENKPKHPVAQPHRDDQIKEQVKSLEATEIDIEMPLEHPVINKSWNKMMMMIHK